MDKPECGGINLDFLPESLVSSWSQVYILSQYGHVICWMAGETTSEVAPHPGHCTFSLIGM